MEAKPSKRLSVRKNRGNRMAELEKNEEKMIKDEQLDIFKEESSDEDFNINDEKIPEDSSIVTSKENSYDYEEYEENKTDFSKKLKSKKNKQKNEEEIFDIENLDLDLIDKIEFAREDGIDVSDKEALDNYKVYSSESDENDEEYTNRKTKKNKNKKKKKKIKKDDNILPEKSISEKNEISINLPLYTEENEEKSLFSNKENNLIDDVLQKKRTRNENKLINLFKKPKREKINKNVNIIGSRLNPKTIIINKKIYYEDEQIEEKINKKQKKLEREEENRKNIINFNLEQEMDTKNIIQKFKEQEKEKKQFSFHDKIISQEQRLFESIFTEWSNKKSLLTMQKLEDLNKRENNFSSKKNLTDFIKIINSEKHIVENDYNNLNENNFNKINVTFSNVEYYNKIFQFFNKKPPNKEKKLCAITGKPAKYYDPLTKSYYSSIDSFKLLRERYFQKEEDGLLFRIQTLSDLASQKKERLKKMILVDEQNNILNSTNNLILNNNNGDKIKENLNQNKINNIKNTNKDYSILNIVNKYGLLKKEGEYEKRIISHRIYNRNRENCLESGMLLEANKYKLVISKKIFKDKYSTKLSNSLDEMKNEEIIL